MGFSKREFYRDFPRCRRYPFPPCTIIGAERRSPDDLETKYSEAVGHPSGSGATSPPTVPLQKQQPRDFPNVCSGGPADGSRLSLLAGRHPSNGPLQASTHRTFIVRAVQLGVNYLDSANIYGPSQMKLWGGIPPYPSGARSSRLQSRASREPLHRNEKPANGLPSGPSSPSAQTPGATSSE